MPAKNPGATAGKKQQGKPPAPVVETGLVPSTQTPEPVVLPTPTSITAGADALLSQAVATGATIDTLERLMKLRREMLAEEAQKAFNKAMAEFQAECPVIAKTKSVKTNDGKLAYKYAPIESAVLQVKELIQKHGFRYSTTMKLKDGNVIAYCRVVHELGHEEVSEMEVPLGNKTQIMSQSQVVAAASTFAKRYAFLNAFGIMTGDEDNDTADQRGDAPGGKKKTTGAPMPTPTGDMPPAPPRSVPPKPSKTKIMEDLNDCKDIQAILNVYETAKKYAWTQDEARDISICFVNRYCSNKRLLQQGVAGQDGQIICNTSGEPVGMVRFDSRGFAQLCKYEPPEQRGSAPTVAQKPTIPPTTGGQAVDTPVTTGGTKGQPTGGTTDAAASDPETFVEQGGDAITKQQVKEIHILCANAKLPDSAYRGMMHEFCGVKSSKEMDCVQAESFIEFLCSEFNLDRVFPPPPEMA